MANNEILQIVVFSFFFGAAASSLGTRSSGSSTSSTGRRSSSCGSPATSWLWRRLRSSLRLPPLYSRQGFGMFAGVCQVHRQFLPLADPAVDVSSARRVLRASGAARSASFADIRVSGAAGFFDLELRSGISANPGAPGRLRRQHAHCLLRAAARAIRSTSCGSRCIAHSACCSSRRSFASI